MKHLSFPFITSIEKRFLPQNLSIRERQRFFVFLYSSVILFIAIPLNLLGLTGPADRFYLWMNTANLLLNMAMFALFATHRISLRTALSTLLLSTQLETSGEMLYCAFYPTIYHLQLIVGDMVLSSIIIMLAVTAYLQFVPIILTAISIGSYAVCIFLTGDDTLLNFFLLFVLIFIVTCVLGEQLIYTVRKLELENFHLKKDEAELLQFIRMNKEQVRAYIEFSKKKNPNVKEMEELLDLMSESSQRNIINSVSNYLAEKQTSMEVIASVFPELTPSEHEICRLILQGKKLSDICETLNKTENNITAHRGHIRKKLKLKPEDNLKKVLEQRMKEAGQ